MYICFFVEGDCEKIFVESFMRSLFPHIIQEKDELNLRRKPDSFCYYIFESESIDRIPYSISDNYYKISESSVLILIVCDTERGFCFSSRKTHILSILEKIEKDKDKKVNRDLLKFIFNKTSIENVYMDEMEHTKNILGSTYRSRCGKDVNTSELDTICLETMLTSRTSQTKLKLISQHLNLIYKKTEFAKKFFSDKFDYRVSKNLTIKRLISSLHTVLPNVDYVG